MNYILFYNIFIPVIAAIIMNGIVYSFGIVKKSTKTNPLIPPGYIIGPVWFIILGLLGYVHYLIYKLNNKITFTSLFIIFIVLFCISYPIITGFREKYGLLLNLITLLLSFILGLLVIVQSKYIFIYIIPFILWSTYVNVAYVIECSQFY